MKKKLICAILLITALSFGGCSSADNVSTSNTTDKNDTAVESTSVETIAQEIQQEERNEDEKTYSIGDTWTVNGQWSLTINSIKETEDRNQYSEKNPAQVFIVEFVYENIGYVDNDGIMDGLFFDLTNGQIVDSDGFMAYSYPGDVTDYAKETPVGAKCKAQNCIGVDTESSEIKIILSKYDGNGNEQKATFILPIE